MAMIDQPRVSTVDALAASLRASATSIHAATAYVTFSGVRLLLNRTPLVSLNRLRKSFLVGIDWFRSEPSALDALQALRKSQVRIVDGAFLIDSPGCRPRRTYHPKSYLVTGDPSVLIVGSANLSANGLENSIELSLSSAVPSDVGSFSGWFEEQWRTATPWIALRDRYTELYRPAKVRDFVVTEDDDIPDPAVLRLRWVTADRLRVLRASQHLWVDVGGLHNRDPQGLPGTDLQFTQMTRVFFGRPAIIVPGNTPLGEYRLTMNGAAPKVRPMVFNKSSSMDRLSLPVPGEDGWPAQYDFGTLLFSKSSDGSYLVTMATGGQRAEWRRRSRDSGFIVEMQRGEREWGVF